MAVAQWIKCSAGELKDPGLIPSQGEFFSLKFLLKRKWTKWRTRATRRTTTQVIPWSLAYGRRQKYILSFLREATLGLSLKKLHKVPQTCSTNTHLPLWAFWNISLFYKDSLSQSSNPLLAHTLWPIQHLPLSKVTEVVISKSLFKTPVLIFFSKVNLAWNWFQLVAAELRRTKLEKNFFSDAKNDVI